MPAFPDRRGQAVVPGASLYYDVTGVGEPIVLVHGFSLDSRMWDPQLAALSEHHQVIRYDLRGFGQSSGGEEPYTHADDLMRLLRHLGLRRATAVGLSLGGGAALNFALLYPEALRALVLVDAMLGGFSWSQEFRAATAAERAAARDAGVAAARALWLTSPLFTPALGNPAAASKLRTMVEAYSGWHWLNRDPGRSLNSPANTRLGEIRAPTLVIVGELDTPDFRTIASTVASGIAGAKLLVVRGAGHLPNLEAPEVFNAAVLGFLRDIEEFGGET